MNAQDYPENDPRHVAHIKHMLDDLLQHCREDSTRVSEPKAQALFETTAELLKGLGPAYEHYATRAEPAMNLG